mmetsp:Transcript_41029/g.59970  ORF Transcript_41029/g.59970 Transcript_41029/m.59970 type:complete len:201 (+) Transcript_41029:66-668(+)
MAPLLLPLGFMFLSTRSGRISSTTTLCQRSSLNRRFMSSSTDAISSLPPLLSTSGEAVKDAETSLSGKRVALYFAAGWCPMCTRFEPSLTQFREAASSSGKNLEIIYVPSDRSPDDAMQRASSLGMMSVPHGKEADDIKTKFKIWSGAEAIKLGFGRRSGVPALVVLDGKRGEEMAFLAAEAEGVNALRNWPLDEEDGIW